MRLGGRIYLSERRARSAAALTVVAGMLATACGVSDEPPPGGDPKVVAAAAPVSTQPVPEPVAPITMVSHEVAAPAGGVSIAGNVTYGDAEKVYRAGRYGEAAELFAAYTSRKPENPWGHYMLGISAWKAGDHGTAETALRRTIELDAKNGKALVNLGRVLLEQNRAAAALDFAEEAVVVVPESPDAWRVLGNVRSALGVTDRAVEAYREALVLDDGDAWTMNNLGLLYIRDARYEEALPPLARAVQLRPKTAAFQNNLGVALERTGHLNEAAEAYRAALEVDPDHERARISLTRVEERLAAGDWPAIDLQSMAGLFADEIAFWREQKLVPDTVGR
jgi:Flp pilus assembly protein TadD